MAAFDDEHEAISLFWLLVAQAGGTVRVSLLDIANLNEKEIELRRYFDPMTNEVVFSACYRMGDLSIDAPQAVSE